MTLSPAKSLTLTASRNLPTGIRVSLPAANSRRAERSRIAPVIAEPIVHIGKIDGVTREHNPVNQKEADQQYQNDTQNQLSGIRPISDDHVLADSAS